MPASPDSLIEDLSRTPPVDLCDHWLFRNMGARLQPASPGDRSYQGTLFRVYAPHARSVSVIGSFNHWDGSSHPMHRNDEGVWQLFIPEVAAGALYKYEIYDQCGRLLPHKADPVGLYAEQPPGNASIVYDPDAYTWQDQVWKYHSGIDRPVSIYEVHLGSWRRRNGQWLSYEQLADELIPMQ